MKRRISPKDSLSMEFSCFLLLAHPNTVELGYLRKAYGDPNAHQRAVKGKAKRRSKNNSLDRHFR